MKSNSERGVALVTTLIMLSLVTFMAVVFLAVSRREKASVTVIGDVINARLMADAAVARAQSEVATRFFTATNPFAYDIMVSTNYFNPNGFQPGIASPLNVNYDHVGNPNGAPLSPVNQANWLRNIANLQYDARPPVFVLTNSTASGIRPYEFRYWLDLNRNGQFEPTGLTNFESEGQSTFGFYVGDPQWIGVLEHPDLPHSETNQFIGRYAYIIVPSGKTLDLNFLHNCAKKLRLDLSRDGFMRNQGVGSWEINLAAFLRDLNTNIWPVTQYNYDPNPTFASSGWAFEDATAILRHRYDANLNNLSSARALFNFAANPNNPFALSGIDYYSDGPLATVAFDNVDTPWAGSYNPDGFYDVQELFDANKTSPAFAVRMTNLPSLSFRAYDRYTFYRLLAQLSTDSQTPDSNKVYFADYQRHYTNRMHLSYQNSVVNGQTNFIPWTPISFFTNAADRLMRASLDTLVLTNLLPTAHLQTNFMVGFTPVRNLFSVTNIQLFNFQAGVVNPAIPFSATNNEYSATVHRLLQLAANIHEATTNSFFPSVFRPVFMRTSTNLIIHGFVEETNAAFLNYPMLTIEQAMGLRPPPSGVTAFAPGVLYTNRNLYGVPVVIGAKKHLPNFNKLVVQTVANVSRRLEVRKTSEHSLPNQTNQMYSISISNRFGVEGWNSYTNNYGRSINPTVDRAVDLRVGVESTLALHHSLEGSALERPPILTSFATNVLWQTNVWPGWTNASSVGSFVVPVDANVTVLSNSIYLAHSGTLLTNAAINLGGAVPSGLFEKSFRVPQLYLMVTNRLQYFLVDRAANRVIDYVNLDDLITRIDLTAGMYKDTAAGGGGIFSDSGAKPGTSTSRTLNDADMWNPVHSNSKDFDSPTLGVLNQIRVAMGNPFVGEGTWANPPGQPRSVQGEIDTFKAFMSGQLTNLAWQVPFTPSRILYLRTSFEANDPLVHYTAGDLIDPTFTNTVPGIVLQSQIVQKMQTDSMLRQTGNRYRPWGGNPNKMGNNDQTAYALSVKDPLVRSSDDWQFPTNRFPNLGWLGRVHRGTPWQTMYLKSDVVDTNAWQQWSGSYGTHPTNDWKLLDLFTVAPNDNASRGLLGVNQTNTAAWSAVLSGVTVLTNTLNDTTVGAVRHPQYTQMFVQPGSLQLRRIVDGINRTHALQGGRPFRTLGDILSVPELTVQSPYLSHTAAQTQKGIDDATYERIPQQILSLLRTDEPRVTVYAFGQSLKPAPRSLVTAANYFNLCTNYQVTGEFATKTVLRLEDLPPEIVSKSLTAPTAQKMHAVVESYSILQPD